MLEQKVVLMLLNIFIQFVWKPGGKEVTLQ